MKRENHLTDAAKTLDIDRSPGRMGKLKAWLLLVILSAILAIAGVVSWVRAQQADSIQYKTRKVEMGNLTVIVTATGTPLLVMVTAAALKFALVKANDH